MAQKFTYEQLKAAGARPSTSSGLSYEQVLQKANGITQTDSQKSVGGFAGNVLSSGFNALKGIGTAIANPYDTISGVAKLGSGVIQKGVGAVTGKPIVSEDTQAVDNVTNFFKERYGSSDKAKETAYKDPVGFLLDASTVLGGAGAIASKVGKVSELSTIARAGSALTKAGEVVNPISQSLNVFGKTASALTKGRTIGGSALDQGAITAAENIGISKENLPISAASKSNVANVTEGLAAKGIGGGGIVDRIRNVYSQVNSKIDELLAGKTPPADLGNKISESAEAYKKDFFRQKNELYKEAVIPKTSDIGKTTIPGKQTLAEGGVSRVPIVATTDKTRSLLQDLISKEKQALLGSGLKTSPELQTYQGYLKGLGNKKLTASDVYQTLQKLEDDIKYGTTIKQGNNAKLSLLQQTLDNEFSQSIKAQRPDLAQALDRADSFYQQGIDKLNSAYTQAIFKNADKPDIIVDSVLPKLQSVEDIKGLKTIIGEENIKGVQQQVLDNIFSNAKSAGGENLTAGGLSRQIKKFGSDKLQELLSPEQYQALTDLEKVSNAMGRGEKILAGSQTAFLGQIGLATGSVSAALGFLLTGNLTGFFAALSPVLGSVALNKFISSSVGRRLLTEGLKLTGSTGEKISEISKVVNPATQVGNVVQSVNQP